MGTEGKEVVAGSMGTGTLGTGSLGRFLAKIATVKGGRNLISYVPVHFLALVRLRIRFPVE